VRSNNINPWLCITTTRNSTWSHWLQL